MIVIAEDEALARMCLVYELRKDYEIYEAENGVEAIRYLDGYRERIWAVLTDVHMPERDGWAVFAHVVARQLPCHLVVISADPVEHDGRWRQYPQATYFPKPVNLAALKRHLAQAHEEDARIRARMMEEHTR